MSRLLRVLCLAAVTVGLLRSVVSEVRIDKQQHSSAEKKHASWPDFNPSKTAKTERKYEAVAVADNVSGKPMKYQERYSDDVIPLENNGRASGENPIMMSSSSDDVIPAEKSRNKNATMTSLSDGVTPVKNKVKPPSENAQLTLPSSTDIIPVENSRKTPSENAEMISSSGPINLPNGIRTVESGKSRFQTNSFTSPAVSHSDDLILATVATSAGPITCDHILHTVVSSGRLFHLMWGYACTEDPDFTNSGSCLFNSILVTSVSSTSNVSKKFYYPTTALSPFTAATVVGPAEVTVSLVLAPVAVTCHLSRNLTHHYHRQGGNCSSNMIPVPEKSHCVSQACKCRPGYLNVLQMCWEDPKYIVGWSNLGTVRNFALAVATVVFLTIILVFMKKTLWRYNRLMLPDFRQPPTDVSSDQAHVDTRLRDCPPQYSEIVEKPPAYQDLFGLQQNSMSLPSRIDGGLDSPGCVDSGQYNAAFLPDPAVVEGRSGISSDSDDTFYTTVDVTNTVASPGVIRNVSSEVEIRENSVEVNNMVENEENYSCIVMDDTTNNDASVQYRSRNLGLLVDDERNK